MLLSPRVSRWLVLASVAGSLSCASSQSRRATALRGNAGGPVRVFTDTDLITDVAATEQHVFVGTARGILKYPAAGGDAQRLGRAEGLPSEDILAVAVNEDGSALWAATPEGVVRKQGDAAFAMAGPAQPDVGRPTALLATGDTLVLGGERGLARFDGTRWHKLTDRYQVTALARMGDRVVVATAQTGVLVLGSDFTSLAEHGGDVMPDTLVRDVVALSGGKLWALCQGPGGAQLGYYDGTRWYGYTTGDTARATWLGIVPRGEGVALVTPGGLYDIVLDRGDDLTPTQVATPSPGRTVTLTPEALEPPPPPPPPPAPPASPRRGRRPAARPPARPAGRAQHLVPVAFQLAGANPETPATPSPATPDAGAPAAPAAPAAPTPAAPAAPAPAAPAAAAPAAAAPAAAAPAAAAPAAAATSTAPAAATPTAPAVAAPAAAVPAAPAAATQPTATPAATPAATPEAPATPPAPVVLPPIRVREVPAPAFPMERPRGGPTLDAPTFGLVRAPLDRVPQDVVRVDGARRELYITRIGLGVTRVQPVTGGDPVDYRTHDLAMSRRALSLATDGRNNVWLVGEDGGPVRYDGRTFARVALEDDAQLHPLMFWSRGSRAIAIARVGDGNILRGYRLEGTTWRRVVSGPVELYGPGMVDVKFLSADERGRFWIGLRALPLPGQQGNARELGTAVLDPDSPITIQYNDNVPAGGGENGSRRAPSDVTAVDFDGQGNAWLAGLDGAVRITPAGEVRRFREAEGVRGDLVSDLARTHGNRMYVATPEGLGFIEGTDVSFAIDGASAMPKVSALAVDTAGNLWGAGARGVWRYDSQTFTRLGRAQGLPGESFNDIAVDGAGRVWLATTEGLVLYDSAVAAEE